MKYIYFTNNSIQTKKLGERLAKDILKAFPRKKAVVLGLKGDLGAGKTTFLQGFAKGLGIKQKVLSPTFMIIKKYKIRGLRVEGRKSEERQIRGLRTEGRELSTFYFLPSTFYHIDCYRIQNSKEILELGFKKIISNHCNIVAIEWSEKIQKALPKQMIVLKFEFINENKRKIIIRQRIC